MLRIFLKLARFTLAVSLFASLGISTTAWAYKVEKICEDLPATSSAPAQKKCKVVRVKEGAAAAKGDGKAEGHGEAPKEAKPAGH